MEKALFALGLFVIVLAGVSLLYAVPVYFLWNAVVPAVFHLPIITFGQALCLSLLCAFLFKSNSGGSDSK